MFKRIARAIWDGPFYIGKLTRPVTTGEAILKYFETSWRITVVILAAALAIALGALGWVKILNPWLHPALEKKVAVRVTYDDGLAANGQPVANDKGDRCSPDHPIKVHLENQSGKAITDIAFVIEGRRDGFSSNLLTGNNFKSDVILQPDYNWDPCYSVVFPYGEKPKDLKYTAKVLSVRAMD